MIVEVVDSKTPNPCVVGTLFGVVDANIETVVGGCAVAVALVVVIECPIDGIIFCARCGECLSRCEYPSCREVPFVVQAVHSDDGNVVAAVVGGCVPTVSVDAVDFVFNPRKGV